MNALAFIYSSLTCSEDTDASEMKVETGLFVDRDIVDTLVWDSMEWEVQMHQQLAILILFPENDEDSEVWTCCI